MFRRLEIFLLLALLPAGAAGAIALRGGGWLALGVSAYGVLLAGVAVALLRSGDRARAAARAAEERDRERARGRQEMQARIEFLSAEREIGLVLNEDVDFRAILDRVLAITCDTLGGSVELWMKDGERLVLRASRAAGRTEFEPGVREDRRVRQCFESGRLLFEAEEGLFHALAPLQADREIVGVARITTPLDGSAEVREERARVLSRHLEEFSKFLALALKTPDLYTRAVEDGLTGLWTKRHFHTQGTLALEMVRRYGEPLSLIMVDIDHFKKINDAHGHVTGDKVLQGVAQILKRRVRGGSAYRYGGEEMAVLLPKADLATAVKVAERLQKAVEAHAIAGVRVTASFGVAQADAGMTEVPQFVEKADGALYQAKDSGRNCVVAASSPSRLSLTG